MDEKVLNEAVENVSIIKGVIDQTSKSFVAFSKIFIYWGLLFIVNSIISLFITDKWDKILELINGNIVLWNIINPGIIILIAAFIYWYISKKISLVGFEKHLMKIWVLILFMSTVQPKINILSTSQEIRATEIIVRLDNFSVILFGLAIALITTALFTGYNHLRNLGIIYICISIVHIFFGIHLLDSATLIQAIYFLPLPFTLLYTGLFLRTQQARRS